MTTMKTLLAIFSGFMTMLIVHSIYRILSRQLGILTGFPEATPWLYWLGQGVVFVGSFYALTKIQAKRSQPTKFLLFLAMILFVTWVCVLSVGLRLSRPMKGMSRFPQENSQTK